jgi:hypothetical protein
MTKEEEETLRAELAQALAARDQAELNFVDLRSKVLTECSAITEHLGTIGWLLAPKEEDSKRMQLIKILIDERTRPTTLQQAMESKLLDLGYTAEFTYQQDMGGPAMIQMPDHLTIKQAETIRLALHDVLAAVLADSPPRVSLQ